MLLSEKNSCLDVSDSPLDLIVAEKRYMYAANWAVMMVLAEAYEGVPMRM